ncbi:MAG: SIMPL domain-containing protein [Holosporales bacterium]|jgi:hypothetical protein|nr:SIMPL domain-containing protein [Holosporales bacterium]
MNDRNSVLHGGIFSNFSLGLGLALCGLFLGKSIERSIHHFKHSNAHVKVRGLVERKVKSDKGVLCFRVHITGNDQDELFTKSKELRETLTKFLAENRVQTPEIYETATRLDDRVANFVPSKWKTSPPKDRYEVQWTTSVTSSEVDKIKALYSKADGFIIAQTMSAPKTATLEFSVDQPFYEFTQLENLRAEILAESTRSARKVADQFAEDSKCKVGEIQTAEQGLFTVESDGGDGIVKKIRLVSYISYFLKS